MPAIIMTPFDSVTLRLENSWKNYGEIHIDHILSLQTYVFDWIIMDITRKDSQLIQQTQDFLYE